MELRNSSEVSFLAKENLQVSTDNGDLIRVLWNLRMLEVWDLTLRSSVNISTYLYTAYLPYDQKSEFLYRNLH